MVVTMRVQDPIILRYQGLFDWSGLYKSMVDWLKKYRFYFHEQTYKHKVPSPKGAEQELRWFAEVDVNDYIRFKMTIEIHLWDMTEVEVVKDGKKKVLTNARMEIVLLGDLILDWMNKFEKSKFTRALRDFYNKYIIRREIESFYGDMLYYRMWNFHSYIKKYLDLQTQWHEYEGYLGESV